MKKVVAILVMAPLVTVVSAVVLPIACAFDVANWIKRLWEKGVQRWVRRLEAQREWKAWTEEWKALIEEGRSSHADPK